jgi:hypothetical protein
MAEFTARFAHVALARRHHPEWTQAPAGSQTLKWLVFRSLTLLSLE